LEFDNQIGGPTSFLKKGIANAEQESRAETQCDAMRRPNPNQIPYFTNAIGIWSKGGRESVVA
jgi:hypothetical protein